MLSNIFEISHQKEIFFVYLISETWHMKGWILSILCEINKMTKKIWSVSCDEQNKIVKRHLQLWVYNPTKSESSSTNQF